MKRHEQKTLRNKTVIEENNQETDLPYKPAQDEVRDTNKKQSGKRLVLQKTTRKKTYGETRSG
jgi:hypothetical protein